MWMCGDILIHHHSIFIFPLSNRLYSSFDRIENDEVFHRKRGRLNVIVCLLKYILEYLRQFKSGDFDVADSECSCRSKSAKESNCGSYLRNTQLNLNRNKQKLHVWQEIINRQWDKHKKINENNLQQTLAYTWYTVQFYFLPWSTFWKLDLEISEELSSGNTLIYSFL